VRGGEPHEACAPADLPPPLHQREASPRSGPGLRTPLGFLLRLYLVQYAPRSAL